MILKLHTKMYKKWLSLNPKESIICRIGSKLLTVVPWDTTNIGSKKPNTQAEGYGTQKLKFWLGIPKIKNVRLAKSQYKKQSKQSVKTNAKIGTVTMHPDY